MSERSDGFRHARTDDVTSVLASRDRVRGDFHVAGGLRVDGVLNGNIERGGPGSAVIISPTGFVKGDLRAGCVRVEGHVRGSLAVDGHVDLVSTAVVEGDIRYGSITINAGAAVVGCLTPDHGDELAQ